VPAGWPKPAPIASAHDVVHAARVLNPWCARCACFFKRLPPKVNTTTNDTMTPAEGGRQPGNVTAASLRLIQALVRPLF
jgi:hypothetical protein